MRAVAGRGAATALAFCLITLLLLHSKAALSHETTTTTVLFDREIVRILEQHCVMCHMDRGLSFPLSTYEQTWLRGRQIRSEVLQRHMPPWAAVPGYGQFANDNSLTLRELQFVIAWVEGLGPRNSGTVFLNVTDATSRPPQEVRAQPHIGHWQLGTPGLIRRLTPNVIEPRQPDHIKRIVMDSGLSSERRVRAIEYTPGDRRVVRAAFFTVQETGQWLGSWTPWYEYNLVPSAASYRLPAGAHIIAEIHYRGTAERVTDEGSLGFFFSNQPTTNTISDLVIDAKGDVPASATGHRFRSQTRLTRNMTAVGLRTEVFPGIKSIEVSAKKPDGATEILLFAKDLPEDWPTPYVFKQPVRLPIGAVLAVTAYYANLSSTPQPGGIRLTLSRY